MLSNAMLDTAIDLLDAGDDLPVLLATDAEEGVLSFEDDAPDACYRAACEHVGELGAACTRYVLAYLGEVCEEEGSPAEDALLFEFGERGMPNAWSGYLLYRRADDGSLEVTDPQPAGEEPLLLSE